MFTRFSQSFAVLALAGGLVFSASCGDDGLGQNTDASDDLSAITDLSGGDMTHDLAAQSKFDLAGADFGGIICGTQTCGAGNICCLVPDISAGTATATCEAASACGDGGIPAACDGYEDCSPGAPNCCVALSMGAGGNSAGGGASCTASCPASVTQSGTGGTVNTKLCHGPSDCANYDGTAPIIGNAPFDKCCGYPGLTFRFCAPGLITLVSNQIMCD
jgi:hypothetical protein